MNFRYIIVVKRKRDFGSDRYVAVAGSNEKEAVDAAVAVLRNPKDTRAVYVVDMDGYELGWSYRFDAADNHWELRMSASTHTVAEIALAVAAAQGARIRTGGRECT